MFGKERPIAVGLDQAAGMPEPGVTEINLEGPISLDLAAVRDELVEVGWHVTKIERADPGLSRQKRIPKIFIMARVIDEADVEFNRTIIWNLMLAGDGLQFTKRCLGALGMPEQLDYPSYQALADALIGLEVDVHVAHKPNKKTWELQASANKWRAVTPDISF